MSAISVQVIGCGDAFGSGGQINTCFYVKCPSVQFLLDCGATTLPALKRYGIAVAQIDLIILTHFHGDHYGGLPFLLLELENYGQVKPLTIISPPGGREKVGTLLEMLYPGSVVLGKLQLEFIDYFPDQTFYTHQISFNAFPVMHTPEALPHGIRITVQGKVISYSGDTGWTDALEDLSEDADLFICECNFYSRQVTGHLNYMEIQRNLPRLKHKKMLLTHFGEEMFNNLQQVKLDYAREGEVIEIA